MSESSENDPSQGFETIADFFHHKVKELLDLNAELVLKASPSENRSVSVLHLIDPHPQEGLPPDYHYAYMAYDAAKQQTSHGLYIANPWPRTQVMNIGNRDRRHYFDGGNSLIVREEVRKSQREIELIRGPSINVKDAEHPDDALALLGLHNDIYKAFDSRPIKPLRLLFNQYVWLK